MLKYMFDAIKANAHAFKNKKLQRLTTPEDSLWYLLGKVVKIPLHEPLH